MSSNIIDLDDSETIEDAEAQIQAIDRQAAGEPADEIEETDVAAEAPAPSSIDDADSRQRSIRESVHRGLGKRLVVDAAFLARSDGDLVESRQRLVDEIAYLRSLPRFSREEAHRRVSRLREKAVEELDQMVSGVATFTVLSSEQPVPAGIADLLVVAESDALTERLHAAVDALELLPPVKGGRWITHETEEARRLDQATREDAIAAIDDELERRAVDREEHNLKERKKGLRARIGGKR